MRKIFLILSLMMPMLVLGSDDSRKRKADDELSEQSSSKKPRLIIKGADDLAKEPKELPNLQEKQYEENTQSSSDLIKASHHGSLESVKILIHKCNINAVDRYNFNALTRAIIGGHEDVAAFLINKEINIFQKCSYGLTPIDYAAKHGLINIIQILLDKGVKVDDQYYYLWLFKAIKNGNKNMVKFLLTKGLDINVVSDGNSALMDAVFNRHENIVKLFIYNGVNIDYVHECKTAIGWADAFGQHAIAKLLKKWQLTNCKYNDNKTNIKNEFLNYSGYAGNITKVLKQYVFDDLATLCIGYLQYDNPFVYYVNTYENNMIDELNLLKT